MTSDPTVEYQVARMLRRGVPPMYRALSHRVGVPRGGVVDDRGKSLLTMIEPLQNLGRIEKPKSFLLDENGAAL